MEKEKTAVEWLKNNFETNETEIISKNIEVWFKMAKEMEKQMLCDLVEQLKDYTNESKSILGHDEREPIEFVEIFLKERN
jgi:prephenate dehydrogenase